MASVFSLENEVFSSFVFYSTICILKFFIMSFLTTYYRRIKVAYANLEDCNKQMFGDYGDGKTKPILNDPDVERTRRIHQNDMENIIPFVLIGLLYVTINPTLSVAVWHFRIFTISRYIHMICYQAPLPQPSRAMAYGVGMWVTVSMAVQNIIATL